MFALLTGYREPPVGVSVREGLHYNPYFPGGAIAMPKMLTDGGVEYDDGTVATESQMAKDVVSFLSWAAEPEMDERKLAGFKWILVFTLALFSAGYYKRWKWSPIKSRKLVLDVIKSRNGKDDGPPCGCLKMLLPVLKGNQIAVTLFAAGSQWLLIPMILSALQISSIKWFTQMPICSMLST